MTRTMGIGIALVLAGAGCKDLGHVPKSGAEGELGTNRIAKSAKRYFATKGAYPVGTAGPTPATPCCNSPGYKCTPDLDQWNAGAWVDLEFVVADKHACRYSYIGTEKTFTATVACDFDCDVIEQQTFTAEGSVDPSGKPVVAFRTTGTD